MRKLVFLLSGFLPALSSAASSSGAQGWAIDAGMRFHLAYIPDGAPPQSGKTERPGHLGFTQGYAPDIDNISLAGILGLGFPIPRREPPEDYKLYLKLFEFPRSWKPRESAWPVIEAFGIGGMPRGKEILAFASKRKNLGVVAFHGELLEAYRKTFKAVEGGEPDKYHYFEDERGAVLRLPKTPLVFQNWRELPMPRDPKREFLTGLLLVYRTEKASSGRLPAASVLEVGSVVRVP